eukprot:10561436-Prorocentrum_lima.AAC.1
MATCILMQESYKVDNFFVQAYGSVRFLQPYHTLIDENFCLKYPDVLPRATRSQLLREFKQRLRLVGDDNTQQQQMLQDN